MKISKIFLLNIICVAVFILSASISHSQTAPNPLIERVKFYNLANQVNNNPMYMDESIRISSGTPYFKDAWITATLYTSAGATYEQIPVKLNLLMQLLLFLDKDGSVKEMVSKMLRVELTDSSTGEKFVFIPVDGLMKTKGSNVPVWCEVLQTGAATLLKSTQKELSQNKIYPLDPKEKVILDSYFYYLSLDGQLFPLKRPKDLVPLLGKSLPAMSSFHPTGQSKEEQFVSMVTYYNQQVQSK